MAALIAITITGCSSLSTNKPTVTDNFNGIHIYSTASNMQSSFLKDKGSGEHFCDSRASDVADTQSEGFGISAAFADQNEGFSETSSRGALALGGRTPAVLITREVMYRTCEIIMNLDLDKETALDLYMKTLEVVTVVVKSDLLEANASIFKAGEVQNIKSKNSTFPTEKMAPADNTIPADNDDY